MGAAYSYQIINLLVTILMVPILVMYLDASGYVCGQFLQLSPALLYK